MPFLELQGITKTYPGVRALDMVDLSVATASVHAIVGENGAGKSTLLKVLGGATQPDSGQLFFDSQPLVCRTPAEALQRGITIVHQELQLVPHLGADANVFLGMESGNTGILDTAAMRSATAAACNSLGLDIDPSTPVYLLSIAQRQLVELARAIVRRSRLVALDEPTATLTPHEVDQLFVQIRRMKADGITVLFVSHRLDEVRAISDEVTVIRDGKTVGVFPGSVTDDEMVRAMVGRSVEYERIPAAREPGPKPILTVHRLGDERRFRDVSFAVHAGEILGIAGLVGSGRSEMARAVAGIEPFTSGTMELKGEEYRPGEPREAIDRGLVYLSEDRQRDGLIGNFTVRENCTLPSLDRFTRRGLVDRAAEAEAVGTAIGEVQLRPPEIEAPVTSFSGGNQQKIVMARWLMTAADVFIFDEPTRGVDVGAKVELHRLIRSLANDGKAVIVISSELPEILALADRIAVMRDGRVAGSLAIESASAESIMNLAVTNAG